MKADLPADITAAGQAGFKALEIWTAKMDKYLTGHTPANLKALFSQHKVRPVSIN